MKQFFQSLLLLAVMLCGIRASAEAAITVQSVGGWFEAGYVKWTPYDGATDYHVYVSSNQTDWTKLDQPLVRKYASYYRADAVGLKAGTYYFKVVPVNASGEITADATITSSFTATAHDRSGFAHYNRSDGVGAYNNDGTLKTNARILYVPAANAKTVSLDMMVSSSKTEIRTGLQNIIQAYEKSAETRPLDVRIIGTIKAADMDEFGSSTEGLQVKGGGSSKCNAQLTIEGIGDDAAIHGFGILCRSISSVEFRNFAIMNCMDDALSLDTDNSNIWIHNMDFFYGQKGSDKDQAKGDGTVDIKGKSKNITVSYNHFWDNGKSSLGGMKSETTDSWMTYHHNWFDHSDSRHPRIRTMFFHIYNNYFDGNSKYGVGVTMGGSAFVENNYFRNCKHPMLISMQGTDAGVGTFSGEDGGVIKAYNNTFVDGGTVLYYDGSQTDGNWDAVKAGSRNENVTATAYTGGTSYNNEATDQAIKAVPKVDDPTTIPTTVCGELGAGRMNGGDFKYTFDNATEDANYDVITTLQSKIVNYESSLVSISGIAAKTASDLALVSGKETVSLGYNDTYTLANGTDFTTSSDGTVTYSSNNTAAATVNATTGEITAVAAGTATITIMQAASDTYQSGEVTVTVNVTDSRNASSFVLTSDDEVTINMGDATKTSQITTTGNAGTVTYSSSKTSVATVSESGLITAVAAGEAIITVKDPGTDAIQGKAYNVTVTVNAASGGDSDDEIVWDFSSSAAQTAAGTITASSTNTLKATDGTSTIDYIAGSNDNYESSSKGYYLKPGGGSSKSNSAYTTRYFKLNITESGTITIQNNSGKSYAEAYLVGTSSSTLSTGSFTTATAGSADNTFTFDVTYNASTGNVVYIAIPSQTYIEKITWTPSGSSTPTAKSTACQLTSIQFSNSAYGSITEPTSSKNGSVKVPYMSGTTEPTVTESTIKISDKASYAISGSTLVVTAEDGTTTATYDITKQAITPLDVTEDIATTAFTEVPSWIYSPYGYDSNKGLKFAKAVDESTNMRIAKGYTHQYYFISAAKALTLTSFGTSRDINVYVNGTKLDSPTASGTSTVEIALDENANNMVYIESNQTSGDGGFTKYAITAVPYALSESTDYSSFTEGTKNVQLTKTFTEGQWTTLALPFSVTSEQLEKAFDNASDCELASITKMDIDNGKIYYRTQSHIDANVPVLALIKPNTSGTYTFEGVTVKTPTDAQLAPSISSGVQLVPVYTKTDYTAYNSISLNLWFLNGGKFYDWSYLSEMEPFQAYIYNATAHSESSAKSFTLVPEGDVETSISGAVISMPENSANNIMYNIAGQRVNSDAKGLLIKNNKKIFVK